MLAEYWKFDLQFHGDEPEEPAHTGLDLNDLDAVMLTKIRRKLVNVVNEHNFIRNELRRRGQVERCGKEFKIPYMVSKSQGFGSRGHKEYFQDAGQSEYRELKGQTRHIYGRVRIWGADADFTNASYKSIVDAVVREIQNYSEAYKTYKTQLMVWDGGVTPLARVESAQALPSGYVEVTLSSDAGPVPTKWLRQGMPIEFMVDEEGDGNMTPVGLPGSKDQIIANVLDDFRFVFVPTEYIPGTNRMEAEIVTGTALEGLVTALAGASVYRNGTYKKDPEGMWSLFGKLSNQLGEIDRSSEDFWFARPHVYRKTASDNGIEKGEGQGIAAEWNLANLRRFENVLLFQGGASKSDLAFFSTNDVADYYIELWANRGGYHEIGPKVDAWPYRTLYFDGIPWLADDFFLDNVLFAGDFSQLVEYLCRDMDWERRGGRIWHWIRGYDAWEAYTVERVQYWALDFTKVGALWDLKGYSEL